MEIVGMRVLDDMELCSDKCKLYEVVGPYGKWWGQSLQGVREWRGRGDVQISYYICIDRTVILIKDMSFLSFLGKLFLLEWLLDDDEENKTPPPPANRSYDYGREDDYYDRVHSLENRIDELERQQDRCDILSDRYDELQDRIDDLQDELDMLDDSFDDF